MVRLLPPYDTTDPVSHFLATLNNLFPHKFKNLSECDMVGITLQNRKNQVDRPIGISFRRKDQLTADVILSLVQKVSQSNSRFNVLDNLIMTVRSVRMPWVLVLVLLRAGQTNLSHGTSQVCRDGEGSR